MCQPWVKLSRRLAVYTLRHWRGFVRDEEDAKREQIAEYARNNCNVLDSGIDPIIDTFRRAYQIPRDTRELSAKHVKAIALARRKPTAKQLCEDLGWSRNAGLGLRDWPERHLALALEDFARRFVGTDFAPKFARSVARTLTTL